jgi:hypothetical protein
MVAGRGRRCGVSCKGIPCQVRRGGRDGGSTPATGALAAETLETVKLAAEMDAGAMLSLKAAVIFLLIGTSVAPATGTVNTTDGRVASAPGTTGTTGVGKVTTSPGVPRTGSRWLPPQPATRVAANAQINRLRSAEKL